MSKMTVGWLVMYFAAAIGSFVNPIFGLLGYLLEYYLRPGLHWWGESLPDLRWSLTISIVVMASYLLRRQSLPDFRLQKNPALPWLLGLLFIMIAITPFAASWDRSLDKVVVFAKILAVYLFITQIVRSRSAFDAVVAMHIAGSAWWGWDRSTSPGKRVQSRLGNVGSGDTLDDNLAAAHLLTVLPFILVYLSTSKDKRLRALALVAAPFVINLIILCNSRGASVGLAGGALAAFILAKKGHRLRLVGATVLVGLVFLGLANPEFVERQRTTTDTNQVTAVERLESWRGAWNLVKDHPLGAGGDGYQVLSPKYIPTIVEEHGGDERAVHNTYMLILSDWGFEGMFLYLGFIGTTFFMLHRVRKRAGPDSDLFYRSFCVEVGLVATLIAQIFVGRLYGESAYWMCALAVALYRMPSVNTADAQEPVPVQVPRLQGFLAARPPVPAHANGR